MPNRKLRDLISRFSGIGRNGIILPLEGRWRVVLIRGGKPVSVQDGKNVIVQNGMNYAAQRIGLGTPAGQPKFVQLGSGSATPGLGDTGLGTPLGTRTTGTLTVTANEFTVAASLPGPGSGTWAVAEMGVFYDVSAGSTLFSRFLIQPITMAVSEHIELTWTVRVGV